MTIYNDVSAYAQYYSHDLTLSFFLLRFLLLIYSARTNNEEDEVRNERNVNFVCTEDEIGVTLDYQPPNLDSVNGRTSSRNVIHSGRRHRSRRRPSRSHESSTSGCGSGNPWIVPFFSGIFTGLIFLIIGIVFVIYFRQLPNYIGILFILVSIPPFCMAINK